MFRQSYQADPTLLVRVFELLETGFPGVSAGVRAAEPLGLDWAAASTPFVMVAGGRLISHVGVLALPLVIDGRAVTAAGIHAVCTHPDHRRRGHYQAVMAEVMAWCDERFEMTLLFADVRELYEPFGFRIVPETRFLVSDVPPSDPARQAGLRKLDWSRRDDVVLLRRLVAERTPVSTRLGVASESAVFAFNALRLAMWYAEELDAIICLTREGGAVRICDVVARTLPKWAELAEYLPADADRVELGFCPDGLGLAGLAQRCGAPGDGLFMVRGPFVAGDAPLMFPRTTQC